VPVGIWRHELDHGAATFDDHDVGNDGSDGTGGGNAGIC
jgi:hypothetical protein